MNSMINSSRFLAAAAGAAVLAACSSIEDVVEPPTIPAPPQTAVLQGTVTGLSTRRPVVLQNNGVSECLSRDDPSVPEGTLVDCRYFGTQGQSTVAFSMGSIPVGTPYNITVKSHPFGKICSVENGVGTVGDSAAIEVTCQNDPSMPRYSVSGTISPAVSAIESAKVILTTEEGVWEVPAAGQSSFTFPDVLFDSQISLPIFTWTVTATYTDEHGTVNNCAVSNGTNAGASAPPSANVTNVAITACNFPVTAAVTYQAESGQPSLPMNPGGMELTLRHHRTGVDVQTLEVSSYSSTARAFPEPVQSTPSAMYELVVTRQPEGHACVIGSSSQAAMAGSVMLLDPTDSTHSWWTSRNVRCRVIPAEENRLRGIYQITTVAPSSTDPTVMTTTVRRNFMAFFENGTFLYGVHGTGVNAYSTSGVLHGFYSYDSAAGTMNMYPLTGNTSAGSGFANPGGTARFTDVVKTPGPGSQITATIGSTQWVMNEPNSIDGQLTGAWAAEDGRRFFVFNAVNYNGFHAGVNGLGNVQDGCFNVEDPTNPVGYYTRRGNATTCSLGSGMWTLDFPAATTTPRLPPNFYGRWPAAGTQLDGRPSSPVNYEIVSGAPDTLTVQETLNGLVTSNGEQIYPPVVLKRYRAN